MLQMYLEFFDFGLYGSSSGKHKILYYTGSQDLTERSKTL